MARRKIDARTPQAKDLRLRGAHIGMDGNVISGADAQTGNTVTMPSTARTMSARPTFMPDLLASHKATQPQRNDSMVTAYRGALQRGAQDDKVRGVVSAAKEQREGRGPVQVTDMRPSRYRASGDGAPRGVAYLDQLGKVLSEQDAATAAEKATGIPQDRSKAGPHYAQDEAGRRAAATTSPTLTRPMPAAATRAVLTDPKYGGGGVGYASRGPLQPKPIDANPPGMRDINQSLRTALTPKLPETKLPGSRLALPDMRPKTEYSGPSKAAETAMMDAANKARTKPSTPMAPEISPIAKNVGYAVGDDGLSHPDTKGEQYDRDGYKVANGQRYAKTGHPMYGPSAEEIGRKLRGIFSR